MNTLRALTPKQWAFAGITLLFVIAVAESVGWLGLCLLEGQMMTYSEIDEERKSVINLEWKPVVEKTVNDLEILEGRVVHPYLGYAYTPQKIEETRVPGEQLEQYGFLPDAGPLIRDDQDDQVVIGIFGGSVARYFLEMEGTDVLRERLEASPMFKGKHIVIDDFGIYGFKQPQQLIALNYLLALGAHFDIVLSLDGFNEVALANTGLQAQGVFPMYPDRWWFLSGSMDSDTRLRLAIGEIGFERQKRANMARAFGYARFSMAAQFLWKGYDRFAARALARREWELSQMKATATRRFALQGPLVRYPSDDEYYADLVGTWQRSAQQMDILAKGKGAMFIEALQPNQYAPHGKWMGPEEKEIAWNEEESYRIGVEKGYPLLSTAGIELKKQGTAFYDLSALFGEIREPLFVDACCHFNAQGNRILAEKLAAIIVQEARELKTSNH